MHEAEQLVRRCRPLLGTFVVIAVPTDCADAIGSAFAAMRHIHERMSFHEETSDLAALRQAEAGHAVRVAPETVVVLRSALDLHRNSRGVFDVSVGRALVTTGFLPRPRGINVRAMTGRTSDLEIVDDERVICHRPMLIDLGGIAKGYAVDQAVETLTSLGVPEGLVNAGGDLRCFGPSSHRIHLRGADGTLDGIVSLTDRALASSSNTHQRHLRMGREASPHLDGRASYVLADKAISVCASTCLIADALTKVALVDHDLARRLVKPHGGDVLARVADRRIA